MDCFVERGGGDVAVSDSQPVSHSILYRTEFCDCKLESSFLSHDNCNWSDNDNATDQLGG